MSDDDVFLSLTQVCEMVCLSRAEIARREEDGVFPKRIPLPGASGVIHQNSRRIHLRSEVRAWMRQQLEAARSFDVPEASSRPEE